MSAFDELQELSGGNAEELIEIWNNLSDDDKDAALLPERAVLAREGVTVDAFCNFHWVMTKKEASPYAKRTWIPELVDAFHNNTGVILDSFRGSGKSFALGLWVLFITGHNPVGSSVIVRINEEAAVETGKWIASLIEFSPGWKLTFPNVQPDSDMGWSSNGYNVKDVSVEYGKWVEMTKADHLGEPSILPAGVTSSSIIGKHPSNGMYFDDLHNEKNTRSVREMQNVVDIFRSDIIPTWNRIGGHPTLAVACTLWHEKDVYHAMMETGLFSHVQQPIMWIDPDGEFVSEAKAYHGEKVSLAWPEEFPMERICKIEDQNPVQFWRMYLCNLEMMKGIALKKEWLSYYPKEDIDPSWPVYFAIDFASTEDKLKDRDRDYFALAIGRAIPGGGIVLTGGFAAKISTGESLVKVQALAAQYPTLKMIGVEKWGKGEEFKNQLLHSTELPILPLPLKGATVHSKGKRFQEGLAPKFMMGRMWIQDVKDKFISDFEDEWIGWDGGKSRTGHDDRLDAVYWLSEVARAPIQKAINAEKRKEPKETKNPYADVGRWIGYGTN